MMDISTASNRELDQLAEEIDARRGARVLDRVYHYLGRFVSYPNEASHVAHAVWIIHTHAMHLWDTTPRLACLSPEKGSGKTRVMEVTEQLVPDPVLCVNATANYLFRKVASEDARPLFCSTRPIRSMGRRRRAMRICGDGSMLAIARVPSPGDV